MSENNKSSLAGKIIKIVLLTILALIVAAVIYVVALFNGKAPVPQAAVSYAATRIGYSEEKKETLEKAVNVYNIVQKSGVSAEVKELRKATLAGTSQEELVQQAHHIYTSLPESTFEEIREELEIAPRDFEEGKEIIDRAMEDFAITGEFTLSEEDQKALGALAAQYGITEESLEAWLQ
ncbi:MAG: hypothetical protein PQJ59_11760 [Spirochaetales bacterium]|nr:hypothetical protein [Spirochaetales bacterium]